ncbi:MAG: ribonuclease H-like domain-containing protein [Rhodobacteraceae bacterium]|nr:ribonuclease H-like domain-containing protein [Paracoccaceae bacterium]
MDLIVFDIETIPQQSPLTDIQTEKLEQKLKRMLGDDFSNKEKYESKKQLIMGTNPYFGEIVCIGIKKVLATGDFDATALIGDEADILNKWWKIIKSHRGRFVHFNGLGFDVPWILKRSMLHKIVPTHREFLDTRRFTKFPHFDVQMIMADWDRYAMASLDQTCEFLNVPSPKEGEVKASEVAQAFKDGRIKEIAEYCLRDVDATHHVYNIVQQYVKF